MGLGVPVTMILPEGPAEELIAEISLGNVGITKIKDSLCKVDVEMAKASIKDDEIKVKALISSSVGFRRVNKRVRGSMSRWAASMVRAYIDILVERDGETDT